MQNNRTEQIVSLIQQGREEYIPALWDAVERLVRWYAKDYYLSKKDLCSRRGVELDDLIQCGYFALLRCLKRYDPEQGAFSSLFIHYLRSEFEKALGRTRRQQEDLLNHSLSLDAELDSSDPESDSLYEMIPDGYDYSGSVEQKIFVQQLHDELEKALEDLPEMEAAAIRAEYWEGLTREEIAEKQSLPVQEVKNNKQKALKRLRKRTKELEQYLDSYTPFYRHTGLGWYRQTKTSSVEYNVLLRDRMERKYDSLYPEE